MTLSTGSVVAVLGPPQRSEARYWDSPHDTVQRADAWFWTCGCGAEPAGPGRFAIAPCTAHDDELQLRFERKSRFASRAIAHSLRPNTAT